MACSGTLYLLTLLYNDMTSTFQNTDNNTKKTVRKTERWTSEHRDITGSAVVPVVLLRHRKITERVNWNGSHGWRPFACKVAACSALYCFFYDNAFLQNATKLHNAASAFPFLQYESAFTTLLNCVRFKFANTSVGFACKRLKRHTCSTPP
jgi:hypothetical protein